MNITPRYERGSGSLILSGRANLEVWLSWFKAAVLKTVVPQGAVGSNPTTSAKLLPTLHLSLDR